MKTFSLVDLIEGCMERQRDAEKERDDAIRYGKWMRSVEGQLHQDQWYGTLESVDDDAEFFDEEARFQAAIIRQLRPIGRRQRLLVQSKDH